MCSIYLKENSFLNCCILIVMKLSCMYVCGVPGTGKTLTTRQVILCLKESVADKVLAPFKFIDVNAFQVTEPHQIYKLIYKVGKNTIKNLNLHLKQFMLFKKISCFYFLFWICMQNYTHSLIFYKFWAYLAKNFEKKSKN